MADRDKVIKGLEQFIADFKPFCGNKFDWKRVDDALALLKDSGQDEGWLCEKRTSGRQITDLLCACGNKVYSTTVLFKDGFKANELYCPNCGLSMRSPQCDKEGVWLRKNWEEVVLKAQEPMVLTLEEVLALKYDDVVYYEVFPTKVVLSAIVIDVIPKRPNINIGVVQLRYAPTWNGINNADLSYYGKTWRCWTERPTEEQREVIPWDE